MAKEYKEEPLIKPVGHTSFFSKIYLSKLFLLISPLLLGTTLNFWNNIVVDTVISFVPSEYQKVEVKAVKVTNYVPWKR